VVRKKDNCDNNKSLMIYSLVKWMGLCSIPPSPVEMGLIKLGEARRGVPSPKLKFWPKFFSLVDVTGEWIT